MKRPITGFVTDEAAERVRAALAEFDRDELPGVPTWVLEGRRFWGKDRLDWLVREIERRTS